ncbi:kinase-like domain-containing protein [Mycena sp. CBHHK59/15]|nr:kinase-like domain-containing protein [Mycena sp. CBHHK59/15]
MDGAQEQEPYMLRSFEVFWRDLSPWLQQCGYTLRPRFRPGWVPSWKRSGQIGALAEDAHCLHRSQIIDAVRLADGLPVVLKRISKEEHPLEEEISSFLSSKPLGMDPKNHCLPMLDILQVPDNPDTQIFVMKLMRKYDEPRFDTLGEAVDFFRQIFEGLQFMHKHLVAHRDCCSNNIMMDGQHLYPEGFHPQFQNHRLDFEDGTPKHITRTQAPPKYYFIDFGISVKFEPDEPRTVIPIRGADNTVPEFENGGDLGPLDPFATDVYFLGNLIREEFVDGQTDPRFLLSDGRVGFDFMRPLVSDMVNVDPKKRPTMDEVVERFEKIVSGLSSWKLRSRVRSKTDLPILDIARIARYWYRRIGFIIRGVPPIPVVTA